MPNPTFFNLPAEKREQITQVAIEEFADNDYDSTSISRIVARAGIAKGSFYQYFADKEDLYAYLLGLLAEAKSQFLSLDHPDPQHIGVFAYLRWTIEVGLAFEMTNPKLTQIGLRAMNAGTLPKAFDAQIREASLSFYRHLAQIGQQQGDIALEVDQELAAVIFDAITNRVGRYILERVVREGAIIGQDGLAFLDCPDVKALFTQMVSVLEYGLGGRVGESTNLRVKGGG